MPGLARDFKQRSWGHKAYIVTQLAGPLGVVLVAVGAMGHNHVVLVAGIVLVGSSSSTPCSSFRSFALGVT